MTSWRTPQQDRSSTVFDHVSRWALYLMVFCVPLTFAPWTTQALDFNKHAVFVVLSAVVLLSWLGKMITQKRLRLRSGWLHLLVLLFGAGVITSGFFSIVGYKTWIGASSQEYTSVMTLLLFIVLFYVTSNLADDTKTQRNILFALLLSASIAGLVALLNLFGMLPMNAGFNTVGTINGLVAFLLAMAFTGFAMWLVSDSDDASVIPASAFGKSMRLLIFTVSIVAFILLVAVDFWVFWATSIVGILLLVIFALLNNKEFPNTNAFILPTVFLLASVFMLIFPSPVRIQTPVVVSPSYQTSWNITKDTLSQGTYEMLFGAGPGTYEQMYAKFKPVEVNRTSFWDVRFDRSKSQLLTSLATFGIVTTILAIAFFGYLGVRALSRLLRERDHEEWRMTFVFFIGWAIMIGLHALYSTDFTRHFMLWLFSGLLAGQVLVNIRQYDFSTSPQVGLASMFGFVTVSVAMLAALLVTGQRYTAELAFAKAVQTSNSGGEISETIDHLNRAVNRNPYNDIYWRNISAAYLMSATQLSQEADGEPNTEQQRAILEDVQQSLNAGQQATNLEPAIAQNWLVRGQIYRDLLAYSQNADQYATATFQRTIDLEPNHPAHYVNLGRVHLALADQASQLLESENEETRSQAETFRTEQLASAAEQFQKAAELKPNYGPAHYYLAATLERQGQLEEAAQRLASIRQASPGSLGVGLQLSLLLIRMEEYASAQAELERLLQLAPNYSNAMWFLASVHEIQGESARAIELVEQVARQNPNNPLVQERLEKLRAGESTSGLPRAVEEGQQNTTEIEAGGSEAPPLEEEEAPPEDDGAQE